MPLTSTPPVVHLALLPGLRPVQREPGVLQVGLDPPRRVLLPDVPDVRRLLASLATGTPTQLGSAVAVTALHDLERAGLLVPVDRMPPGAVPHRTVAAAVARHGADADRRQDARAAARPFLDAPTGVLPDLVRQCRLAGLVPSPDVETATVVLLLVEGEFSRARLDPLVRDGVAHLCVQARAGVVSLGPYVVPGVTACRRCIDAHLGESDPRRPVIVEQLAVSSSREPVDDLLLALAVSWAVQDLATAAEGDRPSTWSTTIELEPGLTTARRPWTRHPHCGCSWDHPVR
jgi:hypothetical protein